MLKKFLNQLASLSLNVIKGIKTHDTTNGFRDYRTAMIKKLTIESQKGFAINLEILIKCFLDGYKITDIPNTWRNRKSGGSKFRLLSCLPHYLKWYFYAFKNSKTSELSF